MEIRGSRILITGGASGIGLECAQALSAGGASVVVVDRDHEAFNALIANPENAKFDARICDVSDPDQVASLVSTLFEGGEELDAVINNAAILRDQTLVSRLGKKVKMHSLEDWQATLDTNLTGTFLIAREVAGAWVQRKRPGVLINTSSVVRTGNAGQSAYSATKAAIDALTVTWAQELAPYKIRVAAIAYGFAETGMTKRIPAFFLEKIKRKSLVGRFATVSELADGCRFILENDYASGRTLELDGGLRF